jgi:hypothetical protein
LNEPADDHVDVLRGCSHGLLGGASCSAACGSTGNSWTRPTGRSAHLVMAGIDKSGRHDQAIDGPITYVPGTPQ